MDVLLLWWLIGPAMAGPPGGPRACAGCGKRCPAAEVDRATAAEVAGTASRQYRRQGWSPEPRGPSRGGGAANML